LATTAACGPWGGNDIQQNASFSGKGTLPGPSVELPGNYEQEIASPAAGCIADPATQQLRAEIYIENTQRSLTRAE
jgi:hypothetical protein